MRQQIGERLPGAFTLFADSIGLTPQELDKALQKGQVTLQDFQTFAESIFNRYGETAKIIASGPEGAGDRLTVALGRLNESVGLLLKPIGAFFQNTFAAIVRDITRATNALARFLNLSFDEGKLAAAQAKLAAAQAIIDDPNAKAKEKSRAITNKSRALTTIRTQTRLRDASADIAQPSPGGGLPGAIPLPPGGATGGRKDMSEAAADARIAAMRLPEVPLFEREQAIRDQAELARLAAESLLPQYKRVELERISLDENKQIAAVHKEMNSVFKELGAGLAEQLKLDAELKASLEDRKFELGMISEEEYFQLQIARERKRLAGMGASEDQIEEQLELFKKLNSQAPEDIIARRMKALKKEMEGLTNLGNVAVRIGDAIGGSFQRNFQDVISGTKSVKEALSDFFADIAEAFLAMAAEIIAKQLVMITYQAILKALGVVMGGGGSSAPVPKDGAAFQGIGTGTLDSLGGAGPIADPKGLFTPPTLISMANGGPAFGGSQMIVGERGPELFIPFTNGSITSSESLGADMANAMAVPFLPGGNRGGTTSQMLNRQENIASNRQENIQINRQENLRQLSVPFSRSSEVSMVVAAEQQTAEAISNPAPLNVRFESQSINGVEYVTAEQHQAGMAEAAQRGRALTLAALQNSVKARRRVGL